MKIIKVKHDKESNEHYLDLKDFKGIVNIKKVKSYTLEPVMDCSDEGETQALILKFYDKDGKVIEAKKK